MPLFAYSAVDAKGKTHQGTLEANNAADAAQAVRMIAIREIMTVSQGKCNWTKPRMLGPRLPGVKRNTPKNAQPMFSGFRYSSAA